MSQIFKAPARPKTMLSALAIAVSCASAAQAQLEEVVVTAQARAESLQDVSISMVAMTGETINELGITKMEEFTMNMPAVTVAQNPIGNFLFIRGVGTSGTNQGIEQSVATFNDGVFMGRHQLSRAPFMDLDRIEVLRGPQSILFGKNTIGGALSVHTARPTDELEGSIQALYGSYGETEVNGVISGPITDTLRGRIAYRKYDYDGYLENVITGEDAMGRDDETIRASLQWDATDSVTVDFKWERSDFTQNESITQIGRVSEVPYNPTAAGITFLNQLSVGAVTGTDGTERIDDERAVVNDGGAILKSLGVVPANTPGFPDQKEGSENTVDAGRLGIEWALGEHALTFISGYASYDYTDICDCDFSALPFIEIDAVEDYEQFSQEIRLTSPTGGTFDYIAGLYYQSSDLFYRSQEAFGVAALAPLANVTRDYDFDQTQETFAVFGSLTWNLSDTTRVTGGLRYTDETKEVDRTLEKSFTGGWDFSSVIGAPEGTLVYGDTAAEYDRFEAELAPVAAAYDAGLWNDSGLLGTYEHQFDGRKRTESFVDYYANIEHDLSIDTLIYATVSTGVKGGGFDARFLKESVGPRADGFEYEEETSLAYEIGFKTTLLDGAMRLNGALFRNEVSDAQVSIFDGATGFVVVNAAEIISQGIELDLQWAATDDLIITAATSYLDSTFDEWDTAPCWARQQIDPGHPEFEPGCNNGFRDAAGDNTQFAPELAYNLNFDWRIPLMDSLETRAVLNINYSDEFATVGDLDPFIGSQDEFTMVDFRLSVGSPDGTWEVAALGKNLTDGVCRLQQQRPAPGIG
ncbi:TonB-dependent receptor [Congregibacter litoralis]|uniref:Outer membrane receptor protein, mostly Fe transport n=1 Tax=Congregibacter litoralis KT71 TaxID=314285 RepID=A4A9P5_9GAMM|nr:TonB-dependent receptor [Congregibacter litoralis]EAQ97212.2 Outer membrane receptor protein, mostly Fe transport [Congregibacter litoralis KT71]